MVKEVASQELVMVVNNLLFNVNGKEGCDVNRIRISETATDKVPNTSPTAGSVSSDINGMAVQHACEQIRERLDRLLDVGTSLNPQIDIGQIEGAFIQGLGLFTMEELIWGENKQYKWIEPGELLTRGPNSYKIPSAGDVPLDMRVSLLSNSSNPRAVYSSKGIGEPPLLLGASVFFALKQACIAYRQQQGLSDHFMLHSPATVERLRMACADEFTRRACVTDHHTFQPKGCY